ncbi:MAG: PAS domain S-box protein [Balneolaceae bacterium]
MKVDEKKREMDGEQKKEIEHLKKSIEEIKRSKEHYQHLIENAGEIITVLNFDGTIRFENPALKRILGYQPDEVVDKNLFNYIHPDDSNKVKQALIRVKRKTGNKSSLEFRYQHKDGTWRHLESFAKNIIDPMLGPGFLFNSRDITHRVNARIELERSKEQLFHAHQIAKIGGWELDINTNQVTLSEELRKLMGLGKNAKIETLEEALQFVHPDDRNKAERNIKSALVKGEGYSFEYRIIQPNGKEKVFYGRGEIETDQDGNALQLTGIGQDITDIKETERKLQTYTQKLKSLTARQEKIRENERIRIARDIHDELGQMLTVLKMDVTSSINRRKKEYGDRYMSRYSDEISEVVNGIDTIIQSVQRITMELRPGALVDLDLKEALEWQCSEFRKQTGIKVKFVCADNSFNNLDDELATTVFRVFQEILTNIMRHANATKVDVLLEKDDDYLHLNVHDNGRGISVEEIDHPESLGILGMKERSATFKGTITFEGDKKKGTLVRLTIPLREKKSSTESEQT